MFVRAGTEIRGILNDWDHSFVPSAQHHESDQPFCSVSNSLIRDETLLMLGYLQLTWQFMSIDLLDRSRTTHQLLDDLQSLFWVLVYIALHHCKHNNDYFLIGNKLFDERTEDLGVDGPVYNGGMVKEKVLKQRQLENFSFVCVPLQRLITDLASAWSRYRHYCYLKETAEAKEATSTVGNPTWLRERLDAALNEEEWEDSDFVSDQFPPRTQNDVNRYMDIAAARQNDRRLEGDRPKCTVDEELRQKLSRRVRIRSSMGDKKRAISQVEGDDLLGRDSQRANKRLKLTNQNSSKISSKIQSTRSHTRKKKIAKGGRDTGIARI